MNFASLAFLVFLPTVWAIYWLLSRRSWQNVLLLSASYFFYGWWDYRFCFLMLASSLIDYAVALRIAGCASPGGRRGWLTASVVSNLGLLAVFKYYNFFIENFTLLAESLGWQINAGTLRIILPVGISFYTFQTLSYTIDAYRRQLTPTRNLIDYLTFVSFFPQLVAGPIERAVNLLPQFQRARHFHVEYLSVGLSRILWGLFKKIAIADTVAGTVNAAFADPSAADGARLALAVVLFAFQIYCDFSGYSDVAIGTAQLFGVKLMRNFAYPYFAQSPREFWQRWHISLSTWFRDYVYIPLGGNCVSAVRRKTNLVLTFLVSGLWHGAAWPFVVWGGLHGAAVAAAPNRKRTGDPRRFRMRAPGGTGRIPTPGVALRILATFLFVCVGWIFFRAETLSDAWMIVVTIAGEAASIDFYRRLGELAAVPQVARGLGLIAFLVVLEWAQRHREHPLEPGPWPQPLQWAIGSAVFWFMVEHAGRVQDNPFIYFQF